MIRKSVAFLLFIIIAALSLGAESTPKTWYQNYCIDNSNISGCASDANDGQQCGCTGGGTHHGPLKTWSEVYVNRLGCGGYGLCPRYTTGFGVAAITYNFISSDTAEYINIETANAGLNNIVFSCALGTAQTVGTGVLSNFTARGGARAGAVAATVASGLNKAAIAGVTLAYNEMVFDSTNSSVFWPYYDITTSGGTPGVGDTWAFSQPMGYLGSAEVTIASGDAVTVYLPSTIQINKIASYPVNTNGGNGQGQNTIVQNCSLGGSGLTSVNANSGVSFYQNAFLSNVQITPGLNGLTTILNNSAPKVAVDVTNSTGGFGGQQNYILGGMYGIQAGAGGSAQNCLTCNGCQMDGDLIFGQTPGALSGSVTTFGGTMYVDANEGLIVYPGTSISFTQSLYAAQGIVWGPGSLAVGGLASIGYKAGAGKAALTFTQKGPITVYSGSVGSVACYLNTTTGVQTCNLPTTAAQLDTTLGATIGCLQVPDGASICN